MDEAVRLAVYQGYAQAGQPPTIDEMAERLGASSDDIRASLRTLHDARHVVLDADGDIVLAHPFASIPFGFSVMGGRTLWWGGCAWDSFAIPHLVADDAYVLVATRCPGCGKALSWVVDR